MNKKTDTDESINEWPLRRENPARRALAEVGITHLRQLTKFSEQELLKLHGVGPKAVRLLREALSTHGQAFAPPDQSSVLSKSADRMTWSNSSLSIHPGGSEATAASLLQRGVDMSPALGRSPRKVTH